MSAQPLPVTCIVPTGFTRALGSCLDVHHAGGTVRLALDTMMSVDFLCGRISLIVIGAIEAEPYYHCDDSKVTFVMRRNVKNIDGDFDRDGRWFVLNAHPSNAEGVVSTEIGNIYRADSPHLAGDIALLRISK